MMENNKEEVKEVLKQIKKDDEINSKSGKKTFFKSKKIKLIILLIILVVIFLFVQRKVLKRYYYSVGNDDMTILEDKEYKLIKNYKEYSEYVKWLQNGYKQEALEKYKQEVSSIITNYRSSYLDPDEYYEKLVKEREEELDKRIKITTTILKSKMYGVLYFLNNDLLIVESTTLGQVLHGNYLNGIYYDNNKLKVYIDREQGGSVGGGESMVYFITLSKIKMKNITEIEIKTNTTNTTAGNGIAYKPIIYLYPTEETQVNVQLGNKEQITCSYPKYTTGWNVIAQPNGDLKDIDTNKNLYSLYYESDNVIEFKVEKDGFIVKGEDSAEFLEEKLKILELTDREAEEFIIYWLPKLEANKYNYIRFATREEIDANMPLTITPEPDTTIRVLMEYKGLENPIEVEEQKLEKIERKGFIAVEWGGTEIK